MPAWIVLALTLLASGAAAATPALGAEGPGVEVALPAPNCKTLEPLLATGGTTLARLDRSLEPLYGRIGGPGDVQLEPLYGRVVRTAC